jgi:hypothetical protein
MFSEELNTVDRFYSLDSRLEAKDSHLWPSNSHLDLASDCLVLVLHLYSIDICIAYDKDFPVIEKKLKGRVCPSISIESLEKIIVTHMMTGVCILSATFF